MGNLAKISPPENYFTPLWDFIVAEGSCQSYLAKLFHVIANREIKIHVYRIQQTANVSGEVLRIENKQLKKVQNDSCGQN